MAKPTYSMAIGELTLRYVRTQRWWRGARKYWRGGCDVYVFETVDGLFYAFWDDDVAKITTKCFKKPETAFARLVRDVTKLASRSVELVSRTTINGLSYKPRRKRKK